MIVCRHGPHWKVRPHSFIGTSQAGHKGVIARGAGNQENRLVQSVAGEYLPSSPVQVDLDPVAVEFDFMEPLFAGGRLGFQGRKLGLNESRHLRFLGSQNPLTRTFNHTKTQRYGTTTPVVYSSFSEFGANMDDEYFRDRALVVRTIADKADPFTKKRLLALADKYDARSGGPSRASRQLRPVAIKSSTQTTNGSGDAG
jgi:hypothetical protein